MEYGVCSFTGHRKIKDEHKKELPQLLARAVLYAYEKGVRCFLSGGAYGFDIIAAREVLRFRATHRDVRLIMLLPCPQQADMWNSHLQSDYEYVLREADETVYVSDSYSAECMKKRNAELVSRADMLVAYVSHMRSGAGQTLNFANRAKKTVYNLYPALEKNI